MERVLTITRQRFEDFGLFHGYRTITEQDLARLVHPEGHVWLDRAVAEQDSGHKQLIPYVVLLQAGNVFAYRREKTGGEKRLHDKWSIGVGGHINPCDGAGSHPYWAGLERELSEEVYLNGEYVEVGLGLINDDSDGVGAVHLGCVHLYRLSPTARVQVKDPALADAQFLPVDTISHAAKWEGWSQILIDARPHAFR